MKRVATTILLSLLLILSAAAVPAQSDTLAQRVQAIMDRPEFKHAMFGIEFYSLDNGKVIYAINADKLFTPGSTTKLLTEGTALSVYGTIVTDKRPSISLPTHFNPVGPRQVDPGVRIMDILKTFKTKSFMRPVP